MSRAKKLLADVLRKDDSAPATLSDSIRRREPRDEATWLAEIEARARRALSCESEVIEVDAAVDRISRDLGL